MVAQHLPKSAPTLRPGVLPSLDPAALPPAAALVPASALAALRRLPHHVPDCRARLPPRRPAVTATRSAFDGDRAFAALQAQCDLGVRPPGSAAHEKCKDYILKQLAPYVDKMDTQTFTFHDPDRHVTLHLTNIIGVINPDGDQENPAVHPLGHPPHRRPGLRPQRQADHRARTTALRERPPCWNWPASSMPSARPSASSCCSWTGRIGGRAKTRCTWVRVYFAQHPGVYKPDYAILLDMIGQKDLQIHRELSSQNLHPELNDKVWAAAAALGYAGAVPRQPARRPSATTMFPSTPPASPPLI